MRLTIMFMYIFYMSFIETCHSWQSLLRLTKQPPSGCKLKRKKLALQNLKNFTIYFYFLHFEAVFCIFLNNLGPTVIF